MENKKKQGGRWQAEPDSRWDVACVSLSVSTLKWLHTPGIQETGAAFTATRKNPSLVTSQFLLNEAVDECVIPKEVFRIDFNKNNNNN